MALRILVVSNLYPPDAVGGYERRCEVTVDGLRSRGHDVVVLTRSGSAGSGTDPPHVRRCLTFRDHQQPLSFLRTRRRDRRDAAAAHAVLDDFRPDVVYLWGMRGVGAHVVSIVTRAAPSVACVGDQWLRMWLAGQRHFDGGVHQLLSLERGRVARFGRVPRIIRSGAARVASRRWADWISVMPTLVEFGSTFMVRDVEAHVSIGGATVVHLGVDLDLFPFAPADGRGRSIVYVGQIVPHKGVFTLVRAFSEVRRADPSARLTIAGTGDRETLRELTALITREHLSSAVQLTGKLSRAEVAGLLRTHAVAAVPSEWDEPTGIVLVEAMASGALVVASAVGGMVEVLDGGRFGRQFPPGDVDGLAAALRDALNDPDRADKAAAARARVEERHQVSSMLDAMEADLAAAASAWP